MKNRIAPPIDTTESFKRITGVSDRLTVVGIGHTIIRNEFDEPLALHVPGLITSEDAGTLAKAARAADPKNAPTILDTVDVPTSKRTGMVYPPVVNTVIKEMIRCLSKEGEATRGIGYATVEQFHGDSYPHFDYSNIGDIALRGGRLTPNLHLTLSGQGVVQVGQVRSPEWVTTLSDGIAQAAKNGMTNRDIDQNFTTAWIEQQADPRVPERFKQGIAYIEQSMRHPSPPTILNPGDAFIFEGCMQGDCLPVVHDFRTIVTPGATEHERMFALFRPQIITLPGEA